MRLKEADRDMTKEKEQDWASREEVDEDWVSCGKASCD